MISVSIPNIKKQIKDFTDHLTDLEKNQIPQATAWALNNTAFDAVKEQRKEAAKVFDRPTKRAINHSYVNRANKATKRNLLTVLSVIDRRGQSSFLMPQIIGGSRRIKKTSLLLQRRGLMPKGYFVTPGGAARLNKNGNISPGQLQQILSGVGAKTSNRYNSKTKAKKKRYFAGEIGGTNGVWERTKKRPRPVLIFVSSVNYKKRLDFFGAGARAFNSNFMRNFDSSLARALRTAK